jgi:NAD(P)-dependent dehydrogenase (short-subunit alcohol dehydrogenase family)
VEEMMESKVLKKFRLDDRVILVTGGAGLLGKRYCKAIVDVGGIAVVADLSGEEAMGVARNIDDRCMGIAMDVADRESVQKGFNAVMLKYGRLDGLVNNAAFNFPAEVNKANFIEFESFPMEIWEKSLEVDLSGAFLCAQEAGKLFRKRGKGVVVNVSSTYGNVAPDQRIYETIRNPDQHELKYIKAVSYSTTKGALINFTRYLAVYWAEFGIRVNCITLGGVFTGQNEGFIKRYESRTPMGRMANLGEYDAVMIFLLSDASSYMTGANLIVDGGWTSW